MPGLIPCPPHIWLAVSPMDMRKGTDGLSAIVQQALGQPPCAGSAFVFRNRAGNRLKLLLWDGTNSRRFRRRRLAVPAPSAPGRFRLADSRRHGFPGHGGAIPSGA